ncbi:MAG: ribonuclease PH [bacterium]
MAKGAKEKTEPGIGPLVRADGRLPDELREVRAQLDYILTSAGSCLIEMGNTRVLCTASAEDRVPPHKRNSGEGWVTAEYSMLPGSGTSRVPRERARAGRAMEIQRLIGRSMRSVVDLSRLGERTIYIDCDVLQADGGTRCAAITGGYLALARAVATLMQTGKMREDPLTGSVAAVSVGLFGGTPILDLDFGEDASADVDMNIVMTGKGMFVEVQGTAEGSAFRKSELNELLTLAEKGIAQLQGIQSRLLSDA